MVECRRIWQDTRDPQQALTKVTRHACIEKALLSGLVKHGHTNYTNALSAISRNMRLMYAHSYQSYVWNTVTSRRLAKLGHCPVIGDLVINTTTQNTNDTSKPTVLTNDNIGDHTIYDVVLPLPGHSVIYPQNRVYEWYEEILSADGIDINHMQHTNKDYSLPGSYRHIVGRVGDMQWSLAHYADYTLPLALSDHDLLQGATLPCSDNTAHEGGQQAVRIDFSLPPSTYATMALREVLRADTSPRHQASLNPTHLTTASDVITTNDVITTSDLTTTQSTSGDM